MCCSTARIGTLRQQEDGHGFGPVGTDDQRLLDIGGFRGAGDKGAEARVQVDAFVDVVHRADEVPGRYDGDDVERNKRQRPNAQRRFVEPDSRILRYGNAPFQHHQIQVIQQAQVFGRGKVV